MTSSSTVDDVLDVEAVTRRMLDAGASLTRAHPEYIRHKPGATTVVAYRFSLPDGGETWGYTRWCADPELTEQFHAKAMTLRPRPSRLGAGLLRLDSHTLLYGFPNDARLRRMRWYTDPRKTKKSLAGLVPPGDSVSAGRTRAEVLRYKPERRVVAKIDLVTRAESRQALLLRYSTQRNAQRLAVTATELRRHGVATPAPVAVLEDGRVGADEFIAGRQLRDVVQSESADGRDLATDLLRFHAVTPPPGVEVRPATADLQKARSGLGGLAAWGAGFEAPAADVGERLTRALPIAGAGDVLLHGDLHPKNILVDGDTLAFVDLERVAVGPAAIDLGCFRGHAIALGIRFPGWSPRALAHADALIAGYRSQGGRLADDALRWHTAIGLVDQALLVSRHLEQGWRSKCLELLDAARSELEPSGAT